MTLINLTTLFGTTPVKSTPLYNPVNFRGSENVNAFQFGGLEGNKDKYSTNPIYGYFNKTKTEIEQIAKSNPKITALLKEHNIPLQVNMKALENLKQGHLTDTRILISQICSSLPKEIKSQINPSEIQQAGLLHDFGKVLIPSKILNKEGCLSPEEKEVMQLHSEFGYELLKQMGVNENVLKLIKYHHQKPDGSGYPAIDEKDDFEHGYASQILSIADKYSALTEERCYHKPCSKDEALEIIAKDVENGTFSQEVFDALKNSLH